MKKTVLSFLAAICAVTAFGQNTEDELSVELKAYYDSIETTFNYEYGTIILKDGLATLTVPKGFKYLNAIQAEEVLVEWWGNPRYEEMTLGFLVPEGQGVLDESDYVFSIEYNELGYVKDKDANKIDYDDLLKDLQEQDIEENKERAEEGYEPIYTVGWAAKPFYDKERKVLHWAKELKFGDEPDWNTLNYNIRILGRKGVLVLNAIARMNELPQVQENIDLVLGAVQFNKGNQYADFNPDLDEVAKWTIGGLVAGKVLAKTGILVAILKFWKIIALAIAGFFGIGWGKKKKKQQEEEVADVTAVEENADDADVDDEIETN